MATYVTGWQAGDLSIHPTELAADRHDNLQHEQVLGAVSPEALAAALDNAMTLSDQRSPLEMSSLTSPQSLQSSSLQVWFHNDAST